jgi:hypothetical protein
MRMKREFLTLGLALAVGFGAAPLQAQRGGGFRGPAAGPRAGRSIEAILENQEALGLTQEQLAEVQDIQKVLEADVLPRAEEIKALRDQIRAGEIDRDEGLRQLQALRGEMMTASAPLRGRVQEILTVEQHSRLQETMWESRPGRGSGGAFQGRGRGRMPRGQVRGSRGGLAPRQGWNGQGRGPALGFRQPLRDGTFGPRAPWGRGANLGRSSIPPVSPWKTGTFTLGGNTVE